VVVVVRTTRPLPPVIGQRTGRTVR